MTKVLFLRGLPDDNHVIAAVSGGKVSFTGYGGANVLQATQYFREKIRVFEAFFLGEGPDEMPGCPLPPEIIFNEISDPDTHGIALGRAERFCQLFQAPVLWLVNSVQRQFMDQSQAILEEEKYVMDTFAERMLPAMGPWIDRIYQVAGLDYFGIDANITEDGKLIVFEVNANMNIMFTGCSMEIHDLAVRRVAHAVEDLIRSRAQ